MDVRTLVYDTVIPLKEITVYFDMDNIIAKTA